MNAHSFKYFVKEGFKNLWSNSIMSAASVLVMVCCMILTGSALLVSLNINSALKSVENKNSITVFLKDGASQKEVLAAENSIKKTNNVLSCEYYSSGQAATKYKDVLGDDLYAVMQEGGNPFPESFHVTMQDLSLYEQTVSDLKKIKNVDSISDRSETADKLSNFNKLIAKMGLLVVCSLGLVSLFIIVNTIKITMHSRRFEISIMKSVGATNGFIRAPFIVEGVAIGVISSLISTGILYLVYSKVFEVVVQILPFQTIELNSVILQVFGGFLAAGMLFGMIGGLISIKRYLTKEGGDVVAW